VSEPFVAAVNDAAPFRRHGANHLVPTLRRDRIVEKSRQDILLTRFATTGESQEPGEGVLHSCTRVRMAADSIVLES
jgi:hypothetical protein